MSVEEQAESLCSQVPECLWDATQWEVTSDSRFITLMAAAIIPSPHCWDFIFLFFTECLMLSIMWFRILRLFFMILTKKSRERQHCGGFWSVSKALQFCKSPKGFKKKYRFLIPRLTKSESFLHKISKIYLSCSLLSIWISLKNILFQNLNQLSQSKPSAPITITNQKMHSEVNISQAICGEGPMFFLTSKLS